MAMFAAALFCLSFCEVSSRAGAAAPVTGGTNAINSQAWFGQPNVPNQGFIRVTYYGEWSVDSKSYTGFRAETDQVVGQKGVWVTVPNTNKVFTLTVDAKATLNDFGTYGLAKGAQPGANVIITDAPYVKGGTFTIRAKLMAKPAANPNAQSVEVASAIQTLTMP